MALPGKLWLALSIAVAAPIVIGSAVALGGWKGAARPAPSTTRVSASPPRHREPIQALARPTAENAAKVSLGRMLFTDKRLSSDASIACIDCHDLAHGGADGRTLAIGIGGKIGDVNTPTVFNADLNVKQFWDGRADSLEAQIDGPIQHPSEMGTTWPAVVARLKRTPEYVAAFDAQGIAITPGTIKDAIATFERTLVTTGSPFDRYLAGDVGALSNDEIAGYRLFKSYGCISCHQGRNVGGNVFETLGVMRDYFADRGGEITSSDLGRFNVTKRPEDRFRFRVPSLRMVAFTAPYLHDGRTATLERAVSLMGEYQLGVDIPPRDVASIAAFLRSLAGTYDPSEPRAGL